MLRYLIPPFSLSFSLTHIYTQALHQARSRSNKELKRRRIYCQAISALSQRLTATQKSFEKAEEVSGEGGGGGVRVYLDVHHSLLIADFLTLVQRKVVVLLLVWFVGVVLFYATFIYPPPSPFKVLTILWPQSLLAIIYCCK